MDLAVSRLAIGLVVALASCLGACTAETRFVVPIEGPRLAPGAPTALDVRNSSGNVFVRVDRSLEEPVVRATLRAVDPTVNPRPATRDQGAVVLARAEEVGGRQILRVEADTPPDVTGAVQIDLVVRTPVCDGVRVQNAGGYVRLWGVGGAIEVDNAGSEFGDLPARFVEVRTDQPVNGPVHVRTSDDDIYYVIGGNSAGVFDITVAPGRTYSVDHRLGSMTNAAPTPQRWVGTFNNGDQPIRLDAASGDVQVRIYERPMSHKSRGIHTP